ncbi:hypothetical protein C8Q72DRAFT_297801 [Fomitopsis betulina]|nr:hypothetical protein C8Q72DRAFT_297801 [Fomitopsis betulina]
MFTRLTNFTLTPAPSALIVIDGTNGATFSHCVPEDGYIECMRTNTTTIHEGGAIGKAREQIGTIRLAEDQSGLPSIVLKDLEVKVRKLWSDTFGRESPLNTPPKRAKSFTPADTVDVARLVDCVLRPAMLEVIRETECRDTGNGKTLSVYIEYVKRSRLGTIFGQLSRITF